MAKIYINKKADLIYKNITENLSIFPFAFSYGGIEYNGFSEKDFKLISKEITKNLHKETTECVFQKDENLRVYLKCLHNFNYGETEWTVWFENVGCQNTEVIEDIKSAVQFTGEHPVLKGILGDHVNYYHPYEYELAPNALKPIHFETTEPLPTHEYFPYFNLEYGDQGAMLAIGWAGSWAADFSFDGIKTTFAARTTNGVKTYLKPGEKIRTALIAIANYTVRNEDYATNYWRDWFINENMPKADKEGNALKPFATAHLAYDTGKSNSDGSVAEDYTTWKKSLEKLLELGINADFRWLDAGWSEAPDGGSAIAFSKDHDWFNCIGWWKPDPAKWPDNTLLESTDYAREHGMKTLAWFAPELVQDVPSLVERHGYKKEWAADFGIHSIMGKAISNLIGNPECYEWTLNRIKKTLVENKIDMYREDYNIRPAKHWSLQDELEGENRRGITELKQVDAHYRLWDEIIEITKSFGGCAFIDNCAGGGGRNDLESARRSVPLLRSDRDRTTIDLRLSITTALNKWLPFNGASTIESATEQNGSNNINKYISRASYLPVYNIYGKFFYETDEEKLKAHQFAFDEWKKVNKYFLKEFYVHTPWRTEHDRTSFTSYSYFDDEVKEGVLFAFRQICCMEDILNIKLPYLNKGETCLLTDEDTGEVAKITYEDMIQNGISITLETFASARILWVKIEK